MAKKKLYGAALAAHQKKVGKKSKAGKKDGMDKPKKSKSLHFSFGDVNDAGMSASEKAYWAEFARQQPAKAKPAKKEPDLSDYPTPSVLHREMTYYRPLTPAQKRAQKAYEQWLKDKPEDPDGGPPPMTAAQKKSAAFKSAYERWEARRPRAAIYSLTAGSR